MFAILFAFAFGYQYAGMTIGCYGTGTLATSCDILEGFYTSDLIKKGLEEEMLAILGEKVIVDIDFKSIKSEKDAANFPSKVASTSLTAMLLAFGPLTKDHPLDLSKLKTECFFGVFAEDATSMALPLDTEKIKKKTVKILSAKTLEAKAKCTKKLINSLSSSPKAAQTELYIKAPASASKYALMLYASAMDLSFVGNCEVNLYAVGIDGFKSDSGLVKSPYVITDSDTLSRALIDSFPLNDVAILEASQYSAAKIEFLADGWKINSDTTIPKSALSGQLSIIQMTINVELSTSSTTVLDINISASAKYVNDLSSMATSRKLMETNSVSFKGNWDAVTNKPKIILEAEDPSTIAVSSQPATITIEKVKYEPKVTGKSKKLSGGAIAGIVIAVIVVVAAVAGVCVYFFVIKPKKSAKNDSA